MISRRSLLAGIGFFTAAVLAVVSALAFFGRLHGWRERYLWPPRMDVKVFGEP